MSSEVDICNVALGYLGDDATVASLSPPEGSAQAAHCARFYPIARDSLLEMHSWGFATKRSSLALLAATPPSPWAYQYAQPADALNLLAILAPDATDDTSTALVPFGGIACAGIGAYTPQPFTEEINDTGASVIYTNQQYAVLRYTALMSDTTKFSPLFTEALAWLLASKLAGPVLKGETGMQGAIACLKQFREWFAKATESDANQSRHQVTQNTAWIANR